MLWACLSKPLAIGTMVIIIATGAVALGYCVTGLIKTNKELKQAHHTIDALKDKNAALSLVVQKQSDAVKLLQAQGETYKGQLAVAVRASEELKKRTAKQIKSIEGQTVDSDVESIRSFLLTGRED